MKRAVLTHNIQGKMERKELKEKLIYNCTAVDFQLAQKWTKLPANLISGDQKNSIITN